jgi:ribonucleoside-triphosphate reductase
MNEMCRNACWIKDTIASDAGYKFAKDVLDFMRNKLSDYQELYDGELFNLESAPAESVCYRFAMHDKKDYPDIITAGDTTDGAPYYTNSSNLPVGYTDDIFEALDHQDDLQTKYTGGTVFHAFLGEKLPDWKSAMKLTRKIAENYKLPYFTFSPTYSICPDHGYITGEHWECPTCGKPTEVYSRVTGYYRAVQNFNDGKAHEFRDRKEYKVKSSDFDSVGSKQIDASPQESCESSALNKPTLFTTSSCPNCKMARQYLDDHNFDYDVIVADINPDLALALGIEQAPTLVLPNGDRFENVSNIIKFVDSQNAKE